MSEENYNGQERRANGHCIGHEKLSTDTTTIKSSFAIAKWVIGLFMGGLIALMMMANGKLTDIQKSLSTSDTAIARLGSDIGHLQYRVTEIETRHTYIDQNNGSFGRR